MEVYHQFFFTNKFLPDWDVDYLFLGTFNPSCGKKLDYYYRRKTNGFWKILKTHFDEVDEFDITNYEGLLKFMKAKRIGCVDIIIKVTFPEEKMNKICGSGFEDSSLFTVKKFTRDYCFDIIKDLVTIQVSKG